MQRGSGFLHPNYQGSLEHCPIPPARKKVEASCWGRLRNPNTCLNDRISAAELLAAQEKVQRLLPKPNG
ncbi:hypothetical protein BDV11DRAFT_184163 [Aspergillus similis]